MHTTLNFYPVRHNAIFLHYLPYFLNYQKITYNPKCSPLIHFAQFSKKYPLFISYFIFLPQVPGILPSPDKMLQGRLFSYSDTHRHRLGANYLQLPVNCPYRTSVKNYQRDGPMTMGDNQAGAPNYFPNSFDGPRECPRAARLNPPYKVIIDNRLITKPIEINNDVFFIFFPRFLVMSNVSTAVTRTTLANPLFSGPKFCPPKRDNVWCKILWVI